MEKKYLKLTPAGQMAIKKITVSASEKSILERIQKEDGFVLPTNFVYQENLDLSTITLLLEKGWLRETDIGHITSGATRLSSQPVPLPSVSEESAVTSVQVAEATPVTLPKIDISEEEKAKSYENFMKIMGSK